jgi:DNA-binding PucR family transcriptional regulator
MFLSDQPIDSLNLDHVGEATTVHHLTEAVGSPILRVLAAPRGLNQRVRGTVLHDQLDALPDEPDAVLLMSGLRADDPEALALIEQAADFAYSAVVVKRRGFEVSALVAAASARGIAVLVAADEIPWQHLDALILSVIGSQGVEAASSANAGGELFALANAIASVIGGSVAIEDIDRRVLAYSSLPDQRIDAIRQRGILDRRVPDMDRNLGQYRTVLASEGVVRFPEATDEFARSAIAIRAGSRPLGTIWAIEELGAMAAGGERVLLDAARLAALHMLRNRNPSAMELEVREGALRAAIDGSLAPSEVAFRLALPGGSTLALIGFAAAPDSDGVTPLITHVGSAITRYVAAFRPDAAIATTSRAVYVLLPGSEQEDARRLADGALRAIRQVFDDRVRSALAQSSPDPADLPAMRREVDDILRVLTLHADSPLIATLSDVHARVVLLHISDELMREPRLRHPGVDAMVTYDRERKTEYARSVTTWMDALGDIAIASDELSIHPNTLRYRLRRAGELFGLSLQSPDDRLSIWLQLRLAQ